MTLESAIKHCMDVADYDCFTDDQRKCSEEHRQLADWLRELKERREKAQLSEEDATFDCISRQDAINALNACCVKYDISPNYDDKRTDKEKFYDWWDMHKVLSMRIINDLPSAEPEIIHCKNCKHRESNDCPMYYEEWIEIDEGDGYFDTDNIIHDWTTDEGFCYCAELRGKEE